MKYGHSRFQKLPEAELYNTLKSKILEQMKRTIDDLPDSHEEPLELDPERSWLRKLPTEPHHMLCRALLERAIASMPRFRMLYADLQPKYFMLQNQLISEKQWSSLLKSRSDVEEEVDFLRHESVRLRPQWADDAIFQEAGYVLRQRETQKK
ncbi:MAG: hypothetical protein KVP17_003111 [Porospora cf. gigantea B]|nr:MAG: hypothetical protein KVP17_003111 [Porospora cf. gigantea B]